MLAVFVSVLGVSYSLAFNPDILLGYSDHNRDSAAYPLRRNLSFVFPPPLEASSRLRLIPLNGIWSMKARKIYYGEKGECPVICHHCGKVSKVDTNDVQPNQVVEIKCGCQNSFQVQFEKRKYFRKDVKLTGTFQRIFPRDKTKGKLFIEDLSYTGIGCRLLAKQPIPMATEIPEQHHSLFATGEMIRLDIEDGKSDHPSFLLGVRFAEISGEDLSFLSTKVLH